MDRPDLSTVEECAEDAGLVDQRFAFPSQLPNSPAGFLSIQGQNDYIV